MTVDPRVQALRDEPDKIRSLGELLAAKTGDPGYLADEPDEDADDPADA